MNDDEKIKEQNNETYYFRMENVTTGSFVVGKKFDEYLDAETPFFVYKFIIEGDEEDKPAAELVIKIATWDFYLDPNYACLCMDDEEADFASSCSDYINSGLCKKDEECTLGRLVCIQRLYVYEKYRGRGIAGYILDNLDRMIGKYIGVDIGRVLIFPRPQHCDENNLNEKEDDPIMLKHMISVLNRHGFKKIKNTNTYQKSYC